MQKIMTRIINGQGKMEDLDRLLNIGGNMVGNTICVLADAAGFPVQSFIRKFRSEFEDYIRGGKKLTITGWQEEKA